MRLQRLRDRLIDILLLRPEESMYADVLDLLLAEFQSVFGYFGYIDSKGDLVCPSMTRHIFLQCEVEGKDVVFPRAIWGGLWGRILVERRSLFKNESHTVPAGHLPLHRSFGSPIVYRGVLIGQIHLANRDVDYGAADVTLLEGVCDFLAPVLNARLRRDEEERTRKRVEEELRTTNEALRTKLEELERMNEVLLEREERMIELKAELAKLRG